jgi:hypothetical protein
MAHLRHDARVCRQKQTSEQIRIAHGWLTPEERRVQAENENRRRLAALPSAQGPAGLAPP